MHFHFPHYIDQSVFAYKKVAYKKDIAIIIMTCLLYEAYLKYNNHKAQTRANWRVKRGRRGNRASTHNRKQITKPCVSLISHSTSIMHITYALTFPRRWKYTIYGGKKKRWIKVRSGSVFIWFLAQYYSVHRALNYMSYIFKIKRKQQHIELAITM